MDSINSDFSQEEPKSIMYRTTLEHKKYGGDIKRARKRLEGGRRKSSALWILMFIYLSFVSVKFLH